MDSEEEKGPPCSRSNPNVQELEEDTYVEMKRQLQEQRAGALEGDDGMQFNLAKVGEPVLIETKWRNNNNNKKKKVEVCELPFFYGSFLFLEDIIYATK